MKKRILSIMLSLIMVVSFMPAMAWATAESDGENPVESVSTADVADRTQLREALDNSGVSTINLTSDIDMGEEVWTPVVVDRPLTINGQGHTISNMKVNAGVLKPSGSGVTGDGGSCDYYAGFIGNNKAELTINELTFSGANVDINPLTDELSSTGSSILAVVVANNTGTLIYNDVNVDSSTVKGYTKVGLLHGFTQGNEPFIANHCTISNSNVVLEADGPAKFAAFSGIIIGYDGKNKAKTNGIKLENNTITIDTEGENCVDYGEEKITYDETTGVNLAGDYGLTCETYAKGGFCTEAVLFEAEIDGYKYETLADAIAASSVGATITLIKNVELTETIKVDKDLTIDLGENRTITGQDVRTFKVEKGTLTLAGTGTVTSVKTNLLAPNSSVIYVGNGTTWDVKGTETAGLVIGANVTIEAPDTYGVAAMGSKTKETVTVKGKIIASSESSALSGNGMDKLNGADFVIETGAEVTATGSAAIYHPQNGTTTISGGKVEGLTGVAIKAGTLNVTGGEVKAVGEFVAPPEPSNNGINSNGTAIQIESNGAYADLVGVYISKNAKLTATNGPAISQYDAEGVTFNGHGGEIGISGGVISAGGENALFSLTEEAKSKTKVSGGTFSSEVPAEYLVEGVRQKKNSDNTFTVYKPSIGGYTPPADNVTNSGTTGTDSATTTADINTTTSGGTTSAVVDKTTADKIVDKAVSNQSTEVVVDATTGAGTAGNTTVTLPTDTVQKIADKTNAEVTVKTDAAEVTLDQKTVEAVASKAAGSTVEILVEKTKDEAKEMEFELKVVSNGVVIGDFDGGNVKVTVKLNNTLKALKDTLLTCVYIDDNGKYSKVGGTKNADGTYTFVTGHFSSYAIMAEEEADAVIEAQAEKLLKGLDDIDLTARSVRTSKGNVKVTLKVDKEGQALIKELKDAGYTVKYNFYRSTKKSAGYVSQMLKGTKTYTNTYGKKGTLYYYKARVQVYDAEGKLVARTALKDCRYASRLWKK